MCFNSNINSSRSVLDAVQLHHVFIKWMELPTYTAKSFMKLGKSFILCCLISLSKFSDFEELKSDSNMMFWTCCEGDVLCEHKTLVEACYCSTGNRLV